MNNDFPFVERIAAILRPDDKLYIQSGQTAVHGGAAWDPICRCNAEIPQQQPERVSDMMFKIERSQMTAFVGASGAANQH